MRPSLDWLIEPGSKDAKSAAQPGSLGTRFLFVCVGPDSLHALARACCLHQLERSCAEQEANQTTCFSGLAPCMDTATKQKATAFDRGALAMLWALGKEAASSSGGSAGSAQAELHSEGNQTSPYCATSHSVCFP
ncbi:hypothetical protein BDA96_02G064900 [Sorghum bicolor]|uniref:Uncharacterized protein n=1 Tax=Sorghum bicolor TaxID=4558 RepID=A0A921RLL4_SORBI|nr:hypothetical protein BDA96_02G064900 [Sorghum bicolor]